MGKRALLAKLLQDIRASYWFLPSTFALFAVVLAQSTLYVDRQFDLLPDAFRHTQVEGARSTLSLISQSMIGVAGVMFSMTIVAVSFASGNFGPRLIGNFMRDRGNQISLGILVSTFVYTLLILRAVQSPFGPEGANDAFVPHLSLVFSFGFAGVSVMSMIYFVHHIPELINVSNISAGLGQRLKTAVIRRIEKQDEDVEDAGTAFPDREPDRQVTLTGSGYIQQWNLPQLRELAQEHDLCLRVLNEAGDFVGPYVPVLDVWSPTELTDVHIGELRDGFALGTEPTEQQNLHFILDQLVEMIARAMSPGVNDPFTAINCLNWIFAGLSTAANHDGGIKPRQLGRVHFKMIDLNTLLDIGIRNTFHYVRSDPMVSKHLRKILTDLAAECIETDARDCVNAILEEFEKLAET